MMPRQQCILDILSLMHIGTPSNCGSMYKTCTGSNPSTEKRKWPQRHIHNRKLFAVDTFKRKKERKKEKKEGSKEGRKEGSKEGRKDGRKEGRKEKNPGLKIWFSN